VYSQEIPLSVAPTISLLWMVHAMQRLLRVCYSLIIAPVAAPALARSLSHYSRGAAALIVFNKT